MTVQEIEYRTPNGLHDAYLFALSIDYDLNVLRLDINWLIGVPDGKTYEDREAYRRGLLIVNNLKYCVVEAPDKRNMKGASYIDGFQTRAEDIKRCGLPEITDGVFRHSIFVGEWNSFIHFAGTSAEISPTALLVREIGAE